MNRADHTIRVANRGDLALLPTIEREAASRFEPYGLAEVMGGVVTSADNFEASYQDGRLWVAADTQGQVVGFALASVVGENAHLDELDVLPTHGRRGIGTALVQAVHEWAIRSDYSAVTLTTLSDIPWNRPFYEALGYQVIGGDDLSKPLRQLLLAEAERGLPSEGRVAMRCCLSSALRGGVGVNSCAVGRSAE